MAEVRTAGEVVLIRLEAPGSYGLQLSKDGAYMEIIAYGVERGDLAAELEAAASMVRAVK